jgi:arginine/lysine/ornithine decarboxylase
MKKGFADVECVREYIGFYQTSSPSYLFMAGMDECMSLIEEKGSHLWDDFFKLRHDFFQNIKGLDYIRIYTDNEPGKLVISVKNTAMTGKELHERLLQKYHIQMEMVAQTYVLGIITMCDTKEGFDRLAEALLAIDKELKDAKLQRRENAGVDKSHFEPTQSSETVKNFYAEAFECEDVVYSLSEIRRMKKEKVPFLQANGSVAADYVNLYPPGIPLLIPGERIMAKHISLIEGYLAKRMPVQGIMDGKIRVCCQNKG